jgi:SAM-dependent methyltransferase
MTGTRGRASAGAIRKQQREVIALYADRMDRDLWAPYDTMGTAYAQHAADSAYNAHYDRPAVLETLGPVRGRRVLDAGCGPGLYAAELIAAGAEVVGCDASPTMVALATERVGRRAQIDLARLGEPLPYDDETFDLGVCALAIHHVDDRRRAFFELYRVLRPGGALVVSTHHPMTDWLHKGGSYFDTVLESETWRLATGDMQVRFWREPLSALCTAATDAGFVIEKLVEPRPAESMRERFPIDFATLERLPGFLVLRLAKLDRGGRRDLPSVA